MDIRGLSLIRNILPFLLPAGVIGLFILIKFRSSRFAVLTGLLTIKPLLATPIWFYIYSLYLNHYGTCQIHPAYVFTALPGIGLTILLALLFRDQFSGKNSKQVYILLVLDTIRWSNSVLFLPHCPPLHELWKDLYPSFFGLAFPTIFSLVSIYFVAVSKKKKSV